MKRIAFSVMLVLFANAFLHAQDITYWKDVPARHEIPAAFKSDPAVIVEENYSITYKDESDKEVWMYITHHQIVKIQDDKGIEDFNKIAMSVYDGETITDIKARTILADNTVLNVSKDKMKEAKEDNGGKQISFAMEGVEKNVEIEYTVTYREPATLFGKEYFQFDVPVMHATFDIISPQRLEFEEKGYNGFPTSGDTLIGQLRKIHAEQRDIPAIHTEPYSFINIDRVKAEYRLSYYPETNDKIRVNTWQLFAKKLYSNVYDISDRESKAVDKFLESNGITATGPEEDRIKKIERAIKKNITFDKDFTNDDLADITAKTSANKLGMLKLYATCFTKADVKHEMGITTDRTENTFDPEFENWNSLENYLFYFPDQRAYLSPMSVYIRYPFTPYETIDEKGVFCKKITIGDMTNAVADIRTIPPMPVSQSHNNINAVISFSPDMNVTAQMDYSLAGYCAMGVREAFVLLPQDKQKEVVQQIVSVADKPEDILKYSVNGEQFDNYSDNVDVAVHATVNASGLVEKAGNKYLLKIGDVIGRQEELYQTSARKLPIDIPYPHSLCRTITVNIPDGYKVSNAEKIKINAEDKMADGSMAASFYSDWKMDGDHLVVTITETYSQLHLPVTNYAAYRDVVDASADFNKVVLLLEKK